VIFDYILELRFLVFFGRLIALNHFSHDDAFSWKVVVFSTSPAFVYDVASHKKSRRGTFAQLVKYGSDRKKREKKRGEKMRKESRTRGSEVRREGKRRIGVQTYVEACRGRLLGGGGGFRSPAAAPTSLSVMCSAGSPHLVRCPGRAAVTMACVYG
jgi:hypothetical protein